MANPPSFDTIQNEIYEYGIGCINRNMPSCSDQCRNLTKTAAACYSCLGQYASCPSFDCAQKPTACSDSTSNDCCTNEKGSCCPSAAAAVQCGTCLAAHGNNSIDTWKQCSSEHGLSKTVIIIIAVVCVVVVVIGIAVAVVVVRTRAQARARAKLVANLKREGVDNRIIHNVADLRNIDSGVFHDADVHMALQQASKRVAHIPPPENVAVTHGSELFTL